MSNLHFFRAHIHHVRHHPRHDDDTVIVTVLAVVVALVIAGMIYDNSARTQAVVAVSTLSPLPPLIDNIPVHDAGQ